MACSESGSSKILLCLTLLVVFGSLCHCARLTTLKALAKLRGNSTRVISQSKGRDVRHGRLLIGQSSMQDDQLGRSKATNAFLDVDYQQDMGDLHVLFKYLIDGRLPLRLNKALFFIGWGEPILLQERGDGVSRPTSKPEREVVDRLLKMDPRVECMGDSMKLQIQYTDSTPGSLIFVDRGSLLSPLPLSKLPPSCGYKIRSTHRDLVLVAPYDGCFVALEEDCYVLPLRWSGLPVRMSCPLRQSSPNPPMVACHPQGMVVKTGWTVSVENINVNLIGDWEPLMTASSRCGFSIVVHSEGVVISARYAPCLEKKNGMYTLELAGEQEIRISCPSLFPLQTGQTSSDGELRTETPIHQVYPSPPSLLTYIQSNVPQGTGSVDQPSIKPPVTQQPTGQLLYPYPFYVKMPYGPPLTPTSEKTTHQISPTMSPTIPTPKNEVPLKPNAPSGPVAHPLYPFYPPTDALWPPQPNTPPSPVGPPFYPFFAKPTAAPWLSQPEASTGHIGQPFYPFYLPTAAPWPSQPEAPTSPAEQPLDPLYPKPTAAPWLPQPEAPPGPEQQPLYPLYAKPTTSPRPSQPESPPDLVEPPLYPFYPRPTAAPWPPHPEAPPGLEQPFYPRPPQPETSLGPVEQPFYPVYHNHTGAPWSPQPEGPPGPVQQSHYPFYAYQTTSPRPSQPEAPPGLVEQPHYPFYPRPTSAPWPPHAEAPPDLEQPLYPFYPRPPQPNTSPGPVEQPFYPVYQKPTGAHWLPQPEAPPAMVEKPLYPVYTGPTTAPMTPQPNAPMDPERQPLSPVYALPTAAPNMPQPEAPYGQVKPPLYHFPFYLPKPSSIDSQNPLPVYCPQFCQSVSLNCCPQIAFHHHVHQIIPFGLDAQDSPSLNKGPQSQPSGAYSGFGNDLLSIPRQKPTDSRTTQATETSTPVPITIPSLQSGNAKTHLLPPDGNLAAPHYIPSKPANPERTIFPYDEPRYLYPSWSYLQQSKELQSLTQSPSPASYTVSTIPQDQRYKQENPVLQYESHNVQPQKQLNLELFGWDMNNPSGSSNGQYGQQKQIVKHQMLQDDESQINDKYTSPNNISGLQTLLRGSRKSNNHGSTLHSSADPKSYVLLQHGPPAGQPNGDIDSPLTSGDLVHDANLRAQLSRHHGKKPERLQNLKTPQEKSKHPKLLG